MGPYAVLLLFLPLCVLMGMTVALGSTQLTLLAVGGVVGLLLLFIPTSWVLTALLLLSFVVVGLAMYYLRINQAAWLPYALCMFLWLKLPLDALAVRKERTEVSSTTPAFLLALYFFFGACVISSLINQTPLINVLVGAKNFIFVWVVAFLVGSADTSQRYLRIAWISVLWLAIVQAPFAVAQHFLSRSPSRGMESTWDAVVGTFGGDPQGGGASGSMAIFLAIAIGVAVSFLKHRVVSAWLCWAAIGSSALAILMAETKAFFLLLPLMLAVVLLRDLRTRPLMVASMAVSCAVGLAGIAYYYSTAYYQSAPSIGRGGDVRSYYDYIAGLDTNPDFINRYTGEVSRFGAPLLWLRQAGKATGGSHLLGFGMTASRASETIGYGAAARQFPFSLTTSALTVLLWDTGLLGALLFLTTIALAAASAWRISGGLLLPPFDRAAMEATAGALCVAVPCMLYNDALVNGPSLQIFFAFLLGYVLHWHRKLAIQATFDGRVP